MLKNYFQIFLNLAVKHKFYGLINVFSLALGLTTVLLIASFIAYELSYDRHYEKAERIYRVASHGEGGSSGLTPAPLAAMMQQEFSEIDTIARFGTARLLLRHEDAFFHEDNLAFADNAFFEVFDFQWMSGDPATALLDPNSIVLTRTLARKYFGTADPMGQTLSLENSYPLVVTGLIEDLPENTHLAASAIASIQAREPSLAAFGGFLENWRVSASSTYVLLKQGADIGSIRNGLPAFAERSIPDPDPGDGLSLTALAALHLNPEDDDAGAGSKATLSIFSATAFCVLLLSVANFINLSIARYSRRIKEVGVRKSVGASRANLLVQFVGEAVLITLVATFFALGLTELLLPIVRGIAGKAIPFDYLGSPQTLLALTALSLLLGCTAGFYPAVYLSGFRPVQVFGRGMTRGPQSMVLRNCLVVGQFSVSIVIIVAALAMNAQMRYLETTDLGYAPDEVVLMPTPATWNERGAGSWTSFRNSLLASPGIFNASHSQGSPLQLGNLQNQFRRTLGDERQRLPLMPVGYDFFTTYAIDFLAGRDFSPSLESDLFSARDPANAGASLSGSYVLNSEAARLLGWTPEEALGQALYFGNSDVPGYVIGVVNDTIRSTRELIRPAVYYNPANPRYAFAGKMAVLLSGENRDAALAHIDRTWKEFFPEEPISREFFGTQIDALYQREAQQSLIFSYFSVLSIFLSCMGLLGLAAFNAESRVKEIGVRKVMGGSVWSIVVLLTNDFSRLVLLSNLIAWPLAYLAMERWLENFAYRIDLTPLVFIGSGLIALCIAWVTVGSTAAKAASAKPVLALRYE